MTLRVIGAVAALVSAAVHLWEWGFNGYRELSVVGPSFLVNVAAGIVIAVLLLTWGHWIPQFLLFGFGLLTLGGFVTATTVGLFGVHERWSGFAIWAAAVAEAIAIVIGLIGLRAAWAGTGRKAAV